MPTTVKAMRRTCDRCGKRLRRTGDGRRHWIVGKDTRITGLKRPPRYCWPGEGCNR